MTAPIPLLLILNLFFILMSRFHSLSLRRNRILIWLPCVGSLVCLGGALWNLQNEPSIYILLVALYASSILFSAWAIVSLGALERTLERTQRSVEFVNLQAFLLSLPMFLPRIEAYAICWLATSWLWGMWKTARRSSVAISPNGFENSVKPATWIRWASPATDCVFFLGLYLFYASGIVENGEWRFPLNVNHSLSSGVLLLWLSSLCRLTLVPLSAMVEDSRSGLDNEDLPYSFMQTVGFAFPAALILLDSNMGIAVSAFEPLRNWMKIATQGSAIFAGIICIICILSTKKSRVTLAALSIGAWSTWLTHLPDTELDWVLVQAFQNFLGLSIVWIMLFQLEVQAAAMPFLRSIAKAVFLWIVAGWALLSPSASVFFQYARYTTLEWNLLAGISFLFCSAFLSIVAGRLTATSYLWGNSEIDDNSSRLWLLDAAFILVGLLYISLDLTVAVSLGTAATSTTSLSVLLFMMPFTLPFLLGLMSAKWMPPPAPFLMAPSKLKPQFETQRHFLSLKNRIAQRLGLFFWYSPTLIIRTSSRAMASASSSALWFFLVLMAALLLLGKGVL